MERTRLHDVVVGLDGSVESSVALRWVVANVSPPCRVHAVHAIPPEEELARDAVLSDSVLVRHRRETDMAECWLGPAAGSDLDIKPSVREGHVAGVLIEVAGDVDADVIVVGHHPEARIGPQLVGHATVQLLRRSNRPVVIVPDHWEASTAADAPVTVGVGVARGSRAAIRWALEYADLSAGISLVHALGPRSIFRSDGLLDVLAYHLDPGVLPKWVEEDLTALAERIRAESVRAGDDVDVSVTVMHGSTGDVLAEAGRSARLLVIGRGEPPFIRRFTIAPYLHHALVDAPCPIVVVPADEEW